MDPPATTTSTTKLRLMCSYGGQIIPRPHTKSLYYSGGDTRIITIPPSPTLTSTISAFTAHISTTLHHPQPFTLKYQLPHQDLDSLITLSSDDDLHIMLNEHHHHSRIRLFLLPPKPNNNNNPKFTHPRTEAWFVDALKSAKIMESGGGGEVQSEGCCLQETMVLETSSSFGSTSSSVSLSSLPPIKAVNVEDSVVCLQDNMVKLPSPNSFASDNSVATAITHPQTGIYQDPVAPVENNVSLNPFDSQSKFPDPPSGVQMHRTVQVSGCPLTPQMDQSQRQHLQFVQMGSHYITQNPNGILPVTSYYPMYNPPLHQHPQQLYYQPNQPYPIYILPVGQTQPYNVPIQCGLIDTATVTPNRPPVHPSTALIPPQVAYKEVTLAPPVPELASQVYRTGPAPAENPLVHVPYNENQHQSMGLPQLHHQPQSIGVASRETANYSIELDDDPICTQIYKSQPPPPTLPSQYQTMTKATTALLSEALAQLHTDNIKQQQIRTSQPQ